MDYRLDHVAIQCRDIKESVRFYEELFDGKPTPMRKGSSGYGFCFVNIDGAASVQLMESDGKIGVHHYGFATERVEQVAEDFRRKGARIIRENRDAQGKLTTIFLEDPNGLQIEVRLPR
jgi:catechol 2,3-dioxygenase-like lactoylglutathione lyase family enzyme